MRCAVITKYVIAFAILAFALLVALFSAIIMQGCGNW